MKFCFHAYGYYSCHHHHAAWGLLETLLAICCVSALPQKLLLMSELKALMEGSGLVQQDLGGCLRMRGLLDVT